MTPKKIWNNPQPPHVYFVSDLHLGSEEDPKLRLFVEFLRGLGRDRDPAPTHLFLLGDIFDLWIASHDYFRNRYRDVIAEIRRLKSEGVDVHYFEGNHDLYLREFWEGQLGVHVHVGPTYFDFGGRTVRLEHGDQMDPEDRGYIFLRWLLRTPVLKWLAPRLPSRLVVAIGERASRKSRAYTTYTKAVSGDRARTLFRAHAQKVYDQNPFDLLVAGHVHHRDEFILKKGLRAPRAVNLGTWLDAPTALEWRGEQIKFIEL